MTKEKILFVRVEESVHNQFLAKCEAMNRPYSGLVREIMVAFNEGRLRIKQTKEQLKQTGDFYVN